MPTNNEWGRGTVMAVDISYAEVPLLPTVSSSSHTIYTAIFLAVAS
jgi:hypothetical protein